MLRSGVLCCAALLAVVATSGVAEARGLSAFHVKVDAKTGKAKVVWESGHLSVNKKAPRRRPGGLAVGQRPEKRDGARTLAAGAMVVVEDGETLRRLDPKSGKPIWSVKKQGLAVYSLPLDRIPGARGRQLLVKTSERLYRIDARSGAIVWDVEATTDQREPIYATRTWSLEPRVERDGGGGVVKLVVRRLSDGGVVATHEIQRYKGFFDIGNARILSVRGRRAIVETSFLILD